MNFFIIKNIDECQVTYQLTAAGYIALIAVFIVLFSIGCMIAEKDKKIGIKQIAFSAMAVALAVVTSMIKIVKLPMGGSVIRNILKGKKWTCKRLSVRSDGKIYIFIFIRMDIFCRIYA